MFHLHRCGHKVFDACYSRPNNSLLLGILEQGEDGQMRFPGTSVSLAEQTPCGSSLLISLDVQHWCMPCTTVWQSVCLAYEGSTVGSFAVVLGMSIGMMLLTRPRAHTTGAHPRSCSKRPISVDLPASTCPSTTRCIFGCVCSAAAKASQATWISRSS